MNQIRIVKISSVGSNVTKKKQLVIIWACIWLFASFLTPHLNIPYKQYKHSIKNVENADTNKPNLDPTAIVIKTTKTKITTNIDSQTLEQVTTTCIMDWGHNR